MNGRGAEAIVNFKNSFGIKQHSLKCVLDIKEFETSTAYKSIELRNMEAIEKLLQKLGSIHSLWNKKLTPQSPETTSMWAYIACKLMDGEYPLEYIFQYGKGAGITSGQMEHAEEGAYRLLKTYHPEALRDVITS